MLASIVIRTLNEARYLGDLLAMIARQETAGLDHEVVLIDSGSTDDTVKIAREHGARVTTISKQEFSFGRSLNMGCDFARGDILVFISGHCIPVDEHWLQNLCQPLIDGVVSYAYGRQVGDDDSYFSERRIFAKYFPESSAVPQEGFFCNNANSAITREAWAAHRFDEELTGLEDMALAKVLVDAGHQVGYVAEASVFHHHSETWTSVRRRFEREALALQRIMPEVQLSRLDVLRYILSSIWLDWRSAARNHHLRAHWYDILRYRVAQYAGSYVGNNDQRRLSQTRKDRFFYPSVNESESLNAWLKPNRRPSPDESQQPAGET
ncbi:glycosyltransferase family 2 protein [Aliiroseovarius sp.]|uniref:glycosyltransferase n=1 Tax=Aliiroseovarius sp. TaxID=1872442 RepID=UPI0026147E86|nr:glycosyltransferase family 2 protein [Aliiroseovarius sp.]